MQDQNEQSPSPVRIPEGSAGTPSSIGLLPCVARARETADRLQSVVLETPFPDLDVTPTTKAELVVLVKQASEWGRLVHQAYGDPESSGSTPDSVWALFARSQVRIVSAELVTKPELRARQSTRVPSTRREIHLEIVGPKILKLRVEPTRRRHFPSLANAADVLGDAPDEFNYSCATTLFPSIGLDSMDVLDERGESVRTALVPAEWPRIRETLRKTRLVVQMKALGFAAWVRSRIERHEFALLPEVQFVRQQARNKVEVIVLQAGMSRTVVLSYSQHGLLSKLKEDGKAQCLRKVKMELIAAIPELAPWILSAGEGSAHAGENEGTYRIADDVRERIRVEDVSEKKR